MEDERQRVLQKHREMSFGLKNVHRSLFLGQRVRGVDLCTLGKPFHLEETDPLPTFTLAYKKQREKTLLDIKKTKQFRYNNNESNNNLEIKAACFLAIMSFWVSHPPPARPCVALVIAHVGKTLQG